MTTAASLIGKPMQPATLPYTELAPGVAVGSPAPAGWRALADCPLLIVVGVTGVGKSTTLGALTRQGFAHTLLPNRRDLTDRLMIAMLQAEDGDPIAPVTDRQQRFAYTRRYRQRHSGGMSHALTQLWVEPRQAAGWLIFDGLRGENEVTHAAALLPHAYFVALHAPDGVRVRRLLGRNDTFDQIAAAPLTGAQSGPGGFAALGLPEAEAILSAAEAAGLWALVAQGAISAGDLRAKLQIVLEERRNYDPQATIAALLNEAAARTLVIDTSQVKPERVAAQIIEQARAWG